MGETMPGTTVSAIELTRSPPPNALVLLGLLFGLFFAVNPQVIVDWSIYSFDDGTYSHAYLIPLMIAYLAWQGYRENMLRVRWSWTFFCLTCAALFLFQWMDFAHQRLAARVLLPLCIIFAVSSTIRVSRYSLSLGALVWFITPIWGPVNALLQTSSVAAVTYIMSFTGIPVFTQANIVEIPAGRFEIAGGCSGLRYVIASLALVSFYSVLYLKRAKSILFLTLLALAGAMLTNWLRIVALILIGHFTDMEAPIIRDHNMFGWFLFIPYMVVLFFFADKLESKQETLESEADPTKLLTGKREVLLLIASILLLSGVMLRVIAGESVFTLKSEVHIDSRRPISLPQKPAPTVFAAESVEPLALVSDAEHKSALLIRFNGSTDAQRIGYFANSWVPEGWQLEESIPGETHHLMLVSRGESRAKVTMEYKAGRWTTGKPNQLRMYNILNALQLNRTTEVRWSFVIDEP